MALIQSTHRPCWQSFQSASWICPLPSSYTTRCEPQLSLASLPTGIAAAGFLLTHSKSANFSLQCRASQCLPMTLDIKPQLCATALGSPWALTLAHLCNLASHSSGPSRLHRPCGPIRDHACSHLRPSAWMASFRAPQDWLLMSQGLLNASFSERSSQPTLVK